MANSRRQPRGDNAPQGAVGARHDCPAQRPRRIFLLGSAFFTGAAVMILELAGNRILAPWFGNSLYTWTGLIGVLLISLSAGYYLGGRLADRWPDYRLLAHLLAASALSTMLVPVLQTATKGSLADASVIVGPILATLLLLAIPACLLATVSPFTVRLLSLLSEDQKVGLSAGAIGMCTTLGSVSGTFCSGFLLIPHFSLWAIFCGVGVVLTLTAATGYLLFSSPFRPAKTVLPLMLATLGLAAAGTLLKNESPSTIIYEQTTFYHRIRVIEAPTKDGDRLRLLFLDSTSEGGQFVESRQVPVDYQQSWELSRAFFSKLKHAAFLGGGAFTMPEALLDAFPESTVDVAELDPAVIDVGHMFFRTDQYPRLHAVAEDARRFLNAAAQRYELIVGDAYHGVRAIPAHLVTLEFFHLVRARLTDDGVYMMNICSAIEGEHATVFRAIAATLRQVFPTVYVFAVAPDRLATSQNVVLVALARQRQAPFSTATLTVRSVALDRFFRGYLDATRYSLAGAPILRDSHNPIEYLIAKSLSDDEAHNP